MKTVMTGLALVFMVFAASAANAEWSTIVTSEDGTMRILIDSTTIGTSKGKPTAWFIYDMKTDQFDYAKIQLMANCSSRQLYAIGIISYNEDDTVVNQGTFYDSPIEYPLPPGSMNEVAYKYLCK
jgi:hypothetical protein